MQLSLKAKPNARQNQIKVVDGVIVVNVKAPPEDGKANKELIAYLSEVFDVPKTRMEISSGAGARQKRIFIPDEYAGRVNSKIGELATEDTDGPR